jgi:protein-L-isoaspartate(D-aspartate) O-methyltransferase
VLEIGTGSGYVTAILASLASRVLSIDRFHTLAAGAQTRLEQLGFSNVDIICGDGLAAHIAGPFDRILAHLSFDAAPASLMSLLAPGGVLICGRSSGQGGGTHLSRIARNPEGKIEETDHGPCMLPKPIPGIAAAL